MPPDPSTPLGRALARASTQHGLITAAQCRDVNLSRSAVHRLAAKGVLTCEAPGVYRVAGVPRTWHGRALCAVLAAGPGAVVSHRSAAFLWGLEGFGAPGRVDITVPRHNRPALRPAVVIHESRDLELADARRRWNVPVTGPARTFLDVAAVADDELTVLRALDEVRRLGHASWADLWSSLFRHARKGRPGIGPARAALHARAGKRVPDTEFARLFLRMIDAAGLPEPRSEVDVTLAGHRYRIDCAYPECLVAIELDGQGHDEPVQIEADARREAHLRSAGWIALRFTWRRFSCEPDGVLADLRAVLSARGLLPPP
jgi:very-short-patch-repair endonuclease